MMQNIVRSSELKHVSLLLGALLLVSPVSGQISTFSDSSGNLVFENRTGGTIFNITNNGGVDMEAKEIRNFFEQDKCGNSEAVKKIHPNGSLECVGISEDQAAEGLSQTLAVNNTANQSIDLASGQAVEFGNDTVTNMSGDIAIGRQAEAIGDIGLFSDPYQSTAVGYSAQARGVGSSAFGRGAQANAKYATALGSSTAGNSEQSVVVGAFTSAGKRGTAVGYDSGNTNKRFAALGYESRPGDFGVAIGNSADSSNRDDAIAIGFKSSIQGQDAIAIGRGSQADGRSSIAIGGTNDGYGEDGAVASSDGSVAIGVDANAPNSYEATFGNLNGEELDVNVTGNLTVHGTSTTVQDLTVEGECTGCGGGGSVGNLSTVMGNGNNAGANLNMKDYNITNNDGANVSVDDNLRVYGNVYTAGADLAEVYSAEGEPAPGTVVKVSDGEKEVEATEARFEDAVGVVSSDPGHVLNSNEDGVRVALEGKVPVRVAPGEEISKGDEVASGKFGMAVACDMGSVSRVSADSSKEELAEAINSLTSNQECLRASFGKALNTSENGFVSVKVE